MEFIHNGDFFIAYWEFVTIYSKGNKLKEKRDVGIPKHIWKQIPDDIKSIYERYKVKIR